MEPNNEFVLPDDDPTLHHVRPGLVVFRSFINNLDVGLGVKTNTHIPKDSFVAVFTGVWAYHADVDTDLVPSVAGEEGHSFREDACVREYAASFGDSDSYVIDNASTKARGVLHSTAHRIMCIVRHNRAASAAAGCPRTHYDPLDPSTPGDVAALFNHAGSDEFACNCMCQSCIVVAEDGMRLALVITTIRDVESGEELRWDYKWEPGNDTTEDEIEIGMPFNATRDLMPWSAINAPPPQLPIPDIDGLQTIGSIVTLEWSKIRKRGNAFRPEWCGPPVRLSTVPSGLAAAVVVTQPSGEDYRRRLPKLIMK